MPLRATDKLEIYIFRAGAMVFYMIDENGERVRCSISERALRRLDPSMKSGEADQGRVLATCRHMVEEIASKKFDGEQFAEGGDTIQILEADVPQEERGD
jgi:Protein of unknown function (DUF1488)